MKRIVFGAIVYMAGWMMMLQSFLIDCIHPVFALAVILVGTTLFLSGIMLPKKKKA